MFYKKGIDITNDKQMFNFLKNHFTYYTLSSWNRLESIANNVKLYNLGLSGDWGVALDLLTNGEYETLNCTVQEWCYEHPGYKVYFNGRSNGYLVLMDEYTNSNILPDCISECEDYEDYKQHCKEYCGSVKANRGLLVNYTKLVQDFDKLCDCLRNYCDELSTLKFEDIAMQKTVDDFNIEYENDLELIGFSPLVCEDGTTNIGEIQTLQCMFEAFTSVAARSGAGYYLERIDDKGNIRFKRNY